jgi:hypothetical protein
LQPSYEHFLKEIEAVEQGDFERVISLAVDNMVTHGADREKVLGKS